MAPLVSAAVNQGFARAVAYDQLETFEAGLLFDRTEGIIPASESTHAIMGAIDLAMQAKEKKEEKVIVFNLSGHGLLDLGNYERYLAGSMPSSTKN